MISMYAFNQLWKKTFSLFMFKELPLSQHTYPLPILQIFFP